MRTLRENISHNPADTAAAPHSMDIMHMSSLGLRYGTNDAGEFVINAGAGWELASGINWDQLKDDIEAWSEIPFFEWSQQMSADFYYLKDAARKRRSAMRRTALRPDRSRKPAVVRQLRTTVENEITSFMDLCAYIDRKSMEELGHYPPRECKEIRAEFTARGFKDFTADSPAFVHAIFDDGWIWGEAKVTARTHTAKLPKDMTRVRKCAPSDCKDTKPYDRRQWCVYNHDDSLAGCHGSKQNALRQKRMRAIHWQESQASTQKKAMGCGDYYASMPGAKYAVSFSPEESELVFALHGGQGDPIYAVASRANSCGITWATEDEIAAVVRMLEKTLDDPSAFDMADAALDTADTLVYELGSLLKGRRIEYPEGIIEEFDLPMPELREATTRKADVEAKLFHRAPQHKDMADALGLDLWGYTPDGDFLVGHKGDDQPSLVMTVPELVAEFNAQFDVVPDGRRGGGLVRIKRRLGAARRADFIATPRRTKKLERWEAAVDAALEELLLDYGAEPTNEAMYQYEIPTSVGPLRLSIRKGSVFSRFDNPEAASQVVPCNPYSGKWNMLSSPGRDINETVAEMQRRLEKVLRG